MPVTYQRIATTTLSTSASSITFSSIPGTYTDLRLVLFGIPALSTAQYVSLRLNSDTGTNYSRTRIIGTGSSASSSRNSNQTSIDITYTDFMTTGQNIFWEVDVFNYAGSTNKTLLATENSDQNGSGAVQKVVGLWRNTNAITEVTFRINSGSNGFASGTTATLYGILKA